MKKGYIYIITNKKNGTLYIGVTNNIKRRFNEHKNRINSGFSSKYRLNKLVFFEEIFNIQIAIEKEKYIKGKSRKFKIRLIEENNPNWNDLSENLS